MKLYFVHILLTFFITAVISSGCASQGSIKDIGSNAKKSDCNAGDDSSACSNQTPEGESGTTADTTVSSTDTLADQTSSSDKSPAAAIPCVDPELTLVSSEVSVKMCDGKTKQGSLKNCSEDGETGCISDQNFSAIPLALLDPTKIKQNVQVGGVTGTLFFVAPEYLHVRASGAGFGGKLKSSCRSTSNLALWDVSPSIPFPSGGTLDDSGGFQPDKWWISSGEVDSYLCDGSQFIDASVDTVNNNEKKACIQGDPSMDCMMFDELSELYWTKANPGNTASHAGLIPAGEWPCGKDSCTISGGNVTVAGGVTLYSSSASMNWFDALYWCDKLVYGGKSDWRLPTFKESKQWVVYGVTNFFTANPGFEFGTFWTSTTAGGDLNNAWDAGTSGQYFSRSKLLAKKVMCVSGGKNR